MLLPLLYNRCLEIKKMAQMKEEIKAPEKIQLSDEEIDNLSDAQFKTLVIRKLTKLVEFGQKLDEKMKAMPVSYTHLRAHETAPLISYAVFCL